MARKNTRERKEMTEFPEIKRAETSEYFVSFISEKDVQKYFVSFISEKDVQKERHSRAKWAKALRQELTNGRSSGSWTYLVAAFEKVDKELLKQSEKDEK
jgi:hypothetical protein